MTSRIGRLLIMLLLVVAFGSAAAVAEDIREGQSKAESRMDLWVGSFAAFAEKHPNLTWDQNEVVWSAINLVTTDSFIAPDGNRWEKGNGAEIKELVRRVQEIFSRNEQGEIFAGMRSTQVWLWKVGAVIAVPFCDCKTLHESCSGPGGGPTGSCSTGCESWSGTGGDYVGICGR